MITSATPSSQNTNDQDIKTINTSTEDTGRKNYKYVREVKVIDQEVGKIDLEIMVINSLTINVEKVQEITDTFPVDKKYISIFCFTKINPGVITFRENAEYVRQLAYLGLQQLNVI